MTDPMFQRAMLTMIFSGISCSLIGVLLVSLKISFLGICMAHAAFLGALISLVVGINPLVGALIATFFTSLIIGPISIKNNISPETVIGIIFSCLMGIALILMKFVKDSAEAMNYLWGSILTITDTNVIFLGILCLISIALIIIFKKQIAIVLFDRVLAESLGIKAGLIFYLIIIICGLITSASIGSVGGLLIFSLILNPAVSAWQLTFSLKKMYFLSGLFGVGSALIGFVVSWYFDLPVGATVVVVSTVIYAICSVFSIKK